MKRFSILFCVMAMLLSIIGTSAFAAEPEEKVIDLGGGYYVVETITQYPMSRSGDTINGVKTGELYYGSTVIGTATLAATFDISGSSAKATNAWISGTGKNGGRYIEGNTSYYNNKAQGTAYFSYNGGVTKLELSISCSPDGTLS